MVQFWWFKNRLTINMFSVVGAPSFDEVQKRGCLREGQGNCAINKVLLMLHSPDGLNNLERNHILSLLRWLNNLLSRHQGEWPFKIFFFSNIYKNLFLALLLSRSILRKKGGKKLVQLMIWGGIYDFWGENRYLHPDKSLIIWPIFWSLSPKKTLEIHMVFRFDNYEQN